MIVAIGDFMLDVVVQAASPLQPGGHCLAQAQVSPGGSAANFAVWARRLGADVGLIGRVGDDLIGRALLRDLEQEGVVSGVNVGEETTGLALALVGEDGSHTMLGARGATAALSVADLHRPLLDQAELLHVTAYSFFEDAPRAAALSAMKYIKDQGRQISLDPSAYRYLQSVGPKAFLALTRGTDIFLPNLDEGRVLTGEREPRRVIGALLKYFPVVALKMGPDGAMAGTDGTIVHHPGFAVPVIDTTGAGDAFAAAFVVSWLNHQDLALAVREGNRVAAGVVQIAGARRFKEVLPGS